MQKAGPISHSRQSRRGSRAARRCAAEVRMKSARQAEPDPAVGQALWFELMQFYVREAWLLDERRFKEWLNLFTDDVLYFMPRRKNVLRRELHREVTAL